MIGLIRSPENPMQFALTQARSQRRSVRGEVPVGAVIVQR